MTREELPEVHIFSDGGANPNPGPGGYGVIMRCGDHQKSFSGGYKKTTNNRMELTGAITGLQNLKKKSRVILTTDSQYTINGIEKWWAKKWRANNWFRTWNTKAVNYDLWEILLNLTEQHEVSFQWIKWHTGHIENEFCDEMATLAMQGKNLLVDEWFIEVPETKQTPLSILSWEERWSCNTEFEQTGTSCKKCDNPLVKKYPKHTKKTLEKQYYYEYYHHCISCKTNYMLEEAKRDIKTLKI